MMQRIFIIAAGIIALIAIGVGVYFIFFNKGAPTLTATTDGNPFGETGDPAFSAPSTLNVGEKLTNAGEEIAPRLIRITKEPVANGAVAFPSSIPNPAFVSQGTTTSTSTPKIAATIPDTEIRYIERASGNVYSYFAKSRTLSRLSNRTLPGVVEAAWAADGSRAFVRFLTQNDNSSESLETYALPANGTGGYILEKNLKEVAVMGTSSVFSLLTSSNGSIGTTAKLDGTGSKTIFSSPLSTIRVFPSVAGYFAATDPAAQTNGYAFRINSTSGLFGRILGPLPALSILPSPSGASVLYSTLQNGSPAVAVLNTATLVSTLLPLATLAEKCVWTKDESSVYCGVPTNISGNLPDDWYQGSYSFSDRLWRISLKDRLATLVVDPSKTGKTDIDMTNLAIDSQGLVLVFTNKKDLSLWAYSL